MSTKPDYEAALAEWKSLHGWQGQVPKATLSVVRLIVDAALGGDPTAFAVAALIAEGGEKVWLCIDERSNGERAIWGAALDDPFEIENCWFGGWRNHLPKCGWHLATPIPVEEETP